MLFEKKRAFTPEFIDGKIVRNYKTEGPLFFPDYTENGVTIKSYWETLDSNADKHIQNICNAMIDNRLSLDNGIRMFHETALLYEDCEISKETSNPFIDFLIDLTEKDEEEIMELYHKISEEVYDF